MSEEIYTNADMLMTAINKLLERKGQRLIEAPLRELEKMIKEEAVAEIRLRTIIEKLIQAGCNIEDIKEFLFDAGIITSDKEWARRHVDIERTVIELMLSGCH